MANELTLDLKSVTVDGERYAVLADQSTVATSGQLEAGERTIGANRETATYIGGGALLGSIIGAVAAEARVPRSVRPWSLPRAPAQIVTKGKSVYLPAESPVTFPLARHLNVGVENTGFDREDRHYHRDYGR